MGWVKLPALYWLTQKIQYKVHLHSTDPICTTTESCYHSAGVCMTNQFSITLLCNHY